MTRRAGASQWLGELCDIAGTMSSAADGRGGMADGKQPSRLVVHVTKDQVSKDLHLRSAHHREAPHLAHLVVRLAVEMCHPHRRALEGSPRAPVGGRVEDQLSQLDLLVRNLRAAIGKDLSQQIQRRLRARCRRAKVAALAREARVLIECLCPRSPCADRASQQLPASSLRAVGRVVVVLLLLVLPAAASTAAAGLTTTPPARAAGFR